MFSEIPILPMAKVLKFTHIEMDIDMRMKACILLTIVGVVIVVQLIENQTNNFDYQKPDDEPLKVSSIQTTTFTTSSQIGIPTISTTTTL